MLAISRRGFLFTALGAAAACSPLSRVTGHSLAPNSRLIIYRHADRVDENLTPQGIARAAAFADALETMEIDAIYSPGIQRNLDTAEPLARAKGLEITRVSVDQIARRIARLSAGQSVVWVGNSGNLRDIWETLDLEGPPPVEYGDLFIVTPDASGAVQIDRRRVEIP